MLEQVTVRQWMTSPVLTAPPSMPINAAHQLMQEKKVRRLLVTEGDKLLGVVTKGDIREARPSDATTLSIWELNYLIANLTIEKVMTRSVKTVHPEDSISKAARLMLEHKISGLPVVDAHDKLVGIITESDIFRMVITTAETTSV